MGMTPVDTCQCGVSEVACSSPITEEDLLCDACRISSQPGYTHATFALKGETQTQHIAIELSLPLS